mmetsp:Transcript_25191/g.43031  ORF Transcript_25191/g.43031 Transcript_25191/m.43031 type:complete len:190 (+) Transcript_25191:90-659(+)
MVMRVTSVAFLAVAVLVASVVLPNAQAQNEVPLMRSETVKDRPSRLHDSAALTAVEAYEHVQDESKWRDDPCPTVGCNSYKCAWVTGEVVSKVVTKKTCSNARKLGNMNGDAFGKKIETLTECVREVKRQLLASEEELKATSNSSAPVLPCSPFFELHMKTYNCACVPHGSDCNEHEDHGVCRYQLREY